MAKAYLSLDGVDLCFPSAPLLRRSIREHLILGLSGRRRTPRLHDVHALRSVSLKVEEGERLGVIGANGSGKTTLLKAIAGIYPINSGSIHTSGRLDALWGLGRGFEPDATGRENILYRGLLLGRSPAEIRAREDDIVSFAGIGDFIDYPLKAYSAGMRVRLAFSITTAFPAEILLLDEVLGGGDASFISRAHKRIEEFALTSRILVLVSHRLAAVKNLCTRAIEMKQGRIVADGPAKAIVADYAAEAQGRLVGVPGPAEPISGDDG